MGNAKKAYNSLLVAIAMLAIISLYLGYNPMRLHAWQEDGKKEYFILYLFHSTIFYITIISTIFTAIVLIRNKDSYQILPYLQWSSLALLFTGLTLHFVFIPGIFTEDMTKISWIITEDTAFARIARALFTFIFVWWASVIILIKSWIYQKANRIWLFTRAVWINGCNLLMLLVITFGGTKLTIRGYAFVSSILFFICFAVFADFFIQYLDRG